jgi:hypothetical protein
MVGNERRKRTLPEAEKAVWKARALKYAYVPAVLIEAGIAAFQGGADKAGFVAISAALIQTLSLPFKRPWWNHAGAIGIAGYLADQPALPVAAGVLIVGDLISHVGHTKTGLGEHDGGDH